MFVGCARNRIIDVMYCFKHGCEKPCGGFQKSLNRSCMAIHRGYVVFLEAVLCFSSVKEHVQPWNHTHILHISNCLYSFYLYTHGHSWKLLDLPNWAYQKTSKKRALFAVPWVPWARLGLVASQQSRCTLLSLGCLLFRGTFAGRKPLIGCGYWCIHHVCSGIAQLHVIV